MRPGFGLLALGSGREAAFSPRRHGGTELGKNGINRKERRDPIERRGGSSAMHRQHLDEAHGEGFGGGEGGLFAGEAGVVPFPI